MRKNEIHVLLLIFFIIILCTIAIGVRNRTPVEVLHGGGIWDEETQAYISPNKMEEKRRKAKENIVIDDDIDARCTKLSQTTGKDFKAFRGRLYRRTGQITNFGIEGTTSKCMITLENNGQYMSFENTLLQDINCEKLSSFLTPKTKLFKESRYSEDHYGLCATIADDNTYIYEIDTLTIIGSQ